MKAFLQRAVPYLLGIAATLALALALLGLSKPAHSLSAVVNGGLHDLTILAHPTTGAIVINETTQQGVNITPTNRSGTIAAANVAQTLMAANTSRRGFLVQNSGAAVLWINELGSAATAAQPSIQIAVGASYQSPPNAASPAAISILGGTLGQAFTAREW